MKLNLFRKKPKPQTWQHEFNNMLVLKDFKAIYYYENEYKTNPIVIRSSFNRELYYRFLKIRRS